MRRMFNETKQRNLPQELPEPTKQGGFLHLAIFYSALSSLYWDFDFFSGPFSDWLGFISIDNDMMLFGIFASLGLPYLVCVFYEDGPTERGRVAGLLLVVGLTLFYFGCFKTALLSLVRAYCMWASILLLAICFCGYLMLAVRAFQTWSNLALNQRLALCMVIALLLTYYALWGIIAIFIAQAIFLFCILFKRLLGRLLDH
jgi:hypothetical protein